LTRRGTYGGLATITGLSRWTLVKIIRREHPAITKRVADTILGAPLRPTDRGCARRIQALGAIGHTINTIAAEAGIRPERLHKAHQVRRYRDDIAFALSRVYPPLAQFPGRSTATISKARTRGDAPPWAWTSVSIDDPLATPNFGLAAARGISWRERVAA
jgi:hypothetical protein